MLRQRIAVSERPAAGRDYSRSISDGEESGVNKCVKWSVFVFNVVFFLAGFALVFIGIIAQLEKNGTYGMLMKSQAFWKDPTWIVFITGLLTFVLGFSGCVGALRENTTLISFYCFILGLMLILEMGLAVTAFFIQDVVFDGIGNIIHGWIVIYRDDSDVQNFVDLIQSEWHCCGARTLDDWDDNMNFGKLAALYKSPEAGGVPFSCCKESYRYGSDTKESLALTCGHRTRLNTTDALHDHIYARGCQEAMKTFIFEHLWVLAFPIAIAFVQMIGICFAQSLKSDIREQKAMWTDRETNSE